MQGLRMHYATAGPVDGPTVVLVHGNPTWSYYFRHVLAALGDHYRCLAPDHIGMGLSDKPDDRAYPHTLARRIDDLGEFLDRCVPTGDVTLVVHDWGGMIGCGWAVRHPERVKALVVLNTAAFPLPAGKRLPWELRLCRLPLVGALLVRGLNLFMRGTVRRCVVRRPLPADVRREYLRPYDSWEHRRAVLRFVEDIPLAPGDRSWETVRQIAGQLDRLREKPLLLGWGLRDFVFDGDFLREWQRRFPTAETRAWDDAGHLVLEDAADELIPAMREFIDRVHGLPPRASDASATP